MGLQCIIISAIQRNSTIFQFKFIIARKHETKFCVHHTFRRHGTSDAFQVNNELKQGMSLPSVFNSSYDLSP